MWTNTAVLRVWQRDLDGGLRRRQEDGCFRGESCTKAMVPLGNMGGLLGAGYFTPRLRFPPVSCSL
jgi:hypothetical protein